MRRSAERILEEHQLSPGRTQRVKHAVTDSYDRARGYMREHGPRDMAGDAGHFVREHPLSSALVGLAAGYLVYRLVAR